MTSIVFFGTEDFSLAALRALVEKGFPVAAVVTKPDSPQGRGHKLMPPAVKTYALDHNIDVLQPQKLVEITDYVQSLDSPTGILVSYGKIIPQSIIDLFTPGIINVHPSLLPKYRGPSPVEAVILNGDQQTGVSIMQLSARMDAGPVYSQETYKLDGTETGPELLEALGVVGIDILTDQLPAIINGDLTPIAQDESEASYCQLITKHDAVIDWNKPATQIEREIRAYAGWPQSRTALGSIAIIVTQAAVATLSPAVPGKLMVEKDRLFVGTAQDWLEILTLKPLGKKEMPIGAFLAGYRSQIDV